MDFGRAQNLTGISFALPPLPARSRHLLESHAAGASRPDWLRSGAPVWARKDWVGRMFPKGTPEKDFLRVYAQRLGAIELNASYYRVPSDAVLDAWAGETPEGFHFCPKLHQNITHQRALAESIPQAQSFAARLARLGPRLGPAFLQLPPWLGADALPELEALLAALPRGFRVAVEFRHPSWFAKGTLIDDAVTVLERVGAGTVITDVAGRRDACHAAITAPFVLVRFAGNNLHPTDMPRADAWVDRLFEWRALGLHAAYLFAHQPDDTHAPEVLDHIASRARERGIAMPVVMPPAMAPTGQLDLFGNAIDDATGNAPGNAPAKKAPLKKAPKTAAPRR